MRFLDDVQKTYAFQLHDFRYNRAGIPALIPGTARPIAEFPTLCFDNLSTFYRGSAPERTLAFPTSNVSVLFCTAAWLIPNALRQLVLDFLKS